MNAQVAARPVYCIRDLARIAGEHLGREVEVRTAPPWMVRLVALLSPKVRPVVPLARHYARPVRYDTARLRGLLGEVERTPLAEAVAVTLDWLGGESSSSITTRSVSGSRS